MEGFIPPHGNYRELLSYQKAEVVYDITFRFCHKFLTRGDRTIDQMIQAARSGKQNILEGSQASGTSKETEIKLTNVARASLEELLEDYRDFLRARDPGRVGQELTRIPLCPEAGRQAPRDICGLSRLLRHSRRRRGGKHCDLPHSPDQLLAGSSDSETGTRLHPGRWDAGAYDPRTAAGALSGEQGPGVITTALTPGIL